MRSRRTFTPKVFVPLFIATMGFASFANMASSPRFATFHTIDVVRLIPGECASAQRWLRCSSSSSGFARADFAR